MTKRVYKLSTDAPDLIARTGRSVKEFALQAGIARATFHALLNPSQHPGRTRGGMHRTTAWKIAQAYARAAGVDEDTAYARLIIEEPIVEEIADLQRDSLPSSAIR